MEIRKTVIKLSETYSVVLKSTLFEDDVDMDRLLRIDVANIYAEVVTFPVILNQLGLLMAEVTEKFNLSKLNLDIKESELKEQFYNQASEKGNKLTEDKCWAKVVGSSVYQIMKKRMFSRQKEMEMVNSLYWAAKSKDEKLREFNKNINPEDVLEWLNRTRLKEFNYVSMKLVKPIE